MIKQILYNSEADCTVLIRKPQVISGAVRTPCTLPLDPPLTYGYFSHLKVPCVNPWIIIIVLLLVLFGIVGVL